MYTILYPFYDDAARLQGLNKLFGMGITQDACTHAYNEFPSETAIASAAAEGNQVAILMPMTKPGAAMTALLLDPRITLMLMGNEVMTDNRRQH